MVDTHQVWEIIDMHAIITRIRLIAEKHLNLTHKLLAPINYVKVEG
jgi:hypothetical protein